MKWQEYAARVDGRANQIARAVLRGIAFPEGDIDPDVQIAVARCFARELSKIADEEGETAFVRCATRAIRWAMIDETLPEVAVMIYMAILFPNKMADDIPINDARPIRNQMLYTDEMAAFSVKFRDVIVG